MRNLRLCSVYRNVLTSLPTDRFLTTRDCWFKNHALITYTRTNLTIYRGADKPLALPGRRQATATEDFDSYILFIIIIGGILVLFVYITRLSSNEIFLPSNKIHREVSRAKDLSAPLYFGLYSASRDSVQRSARRSSSLP